MGGWAEGRKEETHVSAIADMPWNRNVIQYTGVVGPLGQRARSELRAAKPHPGISLRGYATSTGDGSWVMVDVVLCIMHYALCHCHSQHIPSVICNTEYPMPMHWLDYQLPTTDCRRRLPLVCGAVCCVLCAVCRDVCRSLSTELPRGCPV
jgi:hypothetical protein